MRQLILTADDFGLAVPVNEAVERARRPLERRVGLHVVLVEGRPVSAPERVPDLADASGAFPDGLVSAGFRFFFGPGVRRQLETGVETSINERSRLIVDRVPGLAPRAATKRPNRGRLRDRSHRSTVHPHCWGSIRPWT